MNTIYIVSLEPLETRYTVEWFEEFPKLLQGKTTQYNIIQINGHGSGYTSAAVTSGAFLNFTQTNIWKNNQMNQICSLIESGKIQSGDKFIFMDAWNTGIIQLRYMSDLLGLNIEIHSIFHAGSYDPQDFLGRLVKDKTWSYAFEKSIFHASDFNYFATYYHMDLFAKKMISMIEEN